MARRYAISRIHGTHEETVFKRYISYLKGKLRKAEAAGLTAFAKEVRRRARLRLTVNAVMPVKVDDTRYAVHLRDTIHFAIDLDHGAVEFDVGQGLPYADIENQGKNAKGKVLVGNPTMRFFWYRMGRPYQFRRPGFVVRHGKNFFSGALRSTLRDWDKVFGRAYKKEMEKKERLKR